MAKQNDPADTDGFREKARRDRAHVRQQMDDLRKRIQELELAGKGGKDKDSKE